MAPTRAPTPGTNEADEPAFEFAVELGLLLFVEAAVAADAALEATAKPLDCAELATLNAEETTAEAVDPPAAAALLATLSAELTIEEASEV
jgi:hypothetical protein